MRYSYKRCQLVERADEKNEYRKHEFRGGMELRGQLVDEFGTGK
jgi:hypothetical protein